MAKDKKNLMEDVEGMAASSPTHVPHPMHGAPVLATAAGAGQDVAHQSSTVRMAAAPKDETVVTVEGPEGFGSSFGTVAIRAAFVRKVYAILLSQLAVTTAFVAIVCFAPFAKSFYCDGTFYDNETGLLRCRRVRSRLKSVP